MELPLVPLPKPADLMTAIDADPDIALVLLLPQSLTYYRNALISQVIYTSVQSSKTNDLEIWTYAPQSDAVLGYF